MPDEVAKHTAGPFSVEPTSGRYAQMWKVVTPSKSSLGIFERKEDALLFAAAPELLEALKDLLLHTPASGTYEHVHRVERCRSAIQKAEPR